MNLNEKHPKKYWILRQNIHHFDFFFCIYSLSGRQLQTISIATNSTVHFCMLHSVPLIVHKLASNLLCGLCQSGQAVGESEESKYQLRLIRPTATDHSATVQRNRRFGPPRDTLTFVFCATSAPWAAPHWPPKVSLSLMKPTSKRA